MMNKSNSFKKLIESTKSFLFKSKEELSLDNEEIKDNEIIKEEEVVTIVSKTGDEKIGKETSIADLVTSDPEMDDILYEYGLHCGTCFAAGFDTLEDGAKMHGLEDDEIEELIQELNKKADSKKVVDSSTK